MGDQQELLTYLADMLIDTFASDSVLARATASGDPLHRAAADVFVADAVVRGHAAARNALAALPTGDATSVFALRCALTSGAINTIALRRQIADAALSRRAYPFG